MYYPTDEEVSRSEPGAGSEPAPQTDPNNGVRFTYLRTENGQRIYQGSDGRLYTDDPDVNSVSGFIPYAPSDVTNPDTGGTTGSTGGTTGGATGGTTGGTDVTGTNFYTLAGGPPPTSTSLPDAPAWTPPPAFVDPSMDDAMADPGYQFARTEGQRALEASAASRGLLNTGGNLKDLITWGNSFANQRYGEVRNRKMDTYLNNYKTQYLDPYQAAFDVWKAQTGSQEHANDMAWNHWYDMWRGRTSDAFNFYQG